MAELTEVEREKIKLHATFMNNLGIAWFGVGGLAPSIALTTREGLSDYQRLAGIVVFIAVMGGFGIFTHTRALKALEKLSPKQGTSEPRG